MLAIAVLAATVDRGPGVCVAERGVFVDDVTPPTVGVRCGVDVFVAEAVGTGEVTAVAVPNGVAVFVAVGTAVRVVSDGVRVAGTVRVALGPAVRVMEGTSVRVATGDAVRVLPGVGDVGSSVGVGSGVAVGGADSSTTCTTTVADNGGMSRP
jgi:hypothetical protein